MAWLGSVVSVIVATLIIYVSVILLTRLNGLRTFSSMTGFDFAITIGIAGTITSVALGSASLLQGITALATLVAAQHVTSKLRLRKNGRGLIDNEPIVLMNASGYLEENLELARVTKGDVRRALRSQGVVSYAQILAVVYEPTGDISVLKQTDGVTLEPDLLRGVRSHMHVSAQDVTESSATFSTN